MRELLNKISEHNVVVEVVDGKLKVFAKQGNIAPDLLAAIKEQKEELIRYLSGSDQQKFNGSLTVNIPVIPQAESYVLSSGQRRMWILSQFEQGSVAYNMAGSYVFEGDLNQAAFERAFHALMERHENLRTVFKENEEGEVRQYVLSVEATGFAMQYQDLRQEPNPAAKLNELLQFNKMEPYNLAEGPLVRATFYQIADAQWVFGYGLHHIISDGWSNGVMVNELLVLYNAFSNDKANPLPPLRIQYKDYAAWQQEQLSGESLNNHAIYWKKQFGGELPVLNMPGDYPRPAIKTYNGGIAGGHLSMQLTKALKGLAQEQGCTLFMSVVTMVNTLLHRYTGQEDLILGTPMAGREHADLHNQIGLYINTLALRTQFKGTDSIKTLLANVKQVTLGAFEHQVYPFDELIDDLNLQRDLSRNALFDVMVVLQNNEKQISTNGSEQQSMGGVNVGGYSGVEHVVSKLDITFTFEEVGEELHYSIQYNTDIYTAATIERLAKHFNGLVASAAVQPLTPIQRLDYLSATEKEQLLLTFNDTAKAFPQDKTIVDIFEEQAVAHPEEEAVVFEDTVLNYAQMNAVANQLAAHLRKHYDIQADDRVGICLQRSHWLMVAIMGIMKSGGGYVPIDPDYPQERIDYMIADSGCKVIIDEAFIESFVQQQASYSTENLSPIAKPESLAYVIYTSGSTGMPKGVMIEHRNIVNYALWLTTKHDIQPGESTLLLSSITFDGVLTSVFGAYPVGGAVHVLSKEVLHSPTALADYIKQKRITFIKITPPQLKMIVADDESFETFAQAKDLRLIFSGGEAINRADVHKIHTHAKHIDVINHYGPTETTVGTISAKVESALSEIPVGNPINNAQIHIVDPLDQLVPIGVLGEICVSGRGLARGYLNNPEMTAAKYVANPFKPGERMYRTGDIGRWQADGKVVFLGRRDHQVKIRGYRIELGEIEATLQKHPDVTAAVVMARPGYGGDNELAAYITSAIELNVADIRNYLKDQLPDYMVPTHFVQMDVFPLNNSGKVDRKQLPDPEGLGMRTGVEYVAPRNATEETLVSIWSEILGHEKEKISVKDNFFELGGHSLKATRLAGRIYKELEVKLPLQDLFIKAVLEEQAILIEQIGVSQYAAIEPLPQQPHYALSPSQRRLWILSQFAEGNVAYNMPGMYMFDSSINREALTQAFEALIERHESLRTIFHEDETGDVRQYIKAASEVGFKIAYEDLRGTENQEAQVAALLQHNASQPFNLSQGPLLRVALYETDGNALVLGYVLHHIISDGVSMSILMNEVMQLYMAFSNGMPNPLQPLRIQYKDYAAWQLQQMSGEQLQKHADYWYQQFAGEIPVLDLPGDMKRPAMKTYNGGATTHFISPEITNGLKKLAQEQGGTLFMGLLATINALLYKYTNQQDIIIGTQIAGREHANLENQIGFYLNTLALRTQFNASDNFKTLLANVKEVTLGGYEHQVYPFDELVNALPLRRDLSRNALFDISLVLHNTELDDAQKVPAPAADEGEGLQASGFGTGAAPSSKFDMGFGFTEAEGGMMVNIVFNTDIYLPETAMQMMAHLQQLLQAIVHQPTLPLMELDYLTDAEKEQQLVVYNNTAVDYPRDKTIMELFQEQVDKTPDAPAVIFGQKQLTYAELNDKANRLAHYLQVNHQLQYDDLVGIMLDRSENMMVAILGVLKSGAGYVPVDTEHPKGRKSFILKDTAVKALITQTDYIFELEFFNGPVIALDVQLETMEAPTEPVSSLTGAGNLAYIMYTSGSTGTPKGVLVPHRAVVRLVKSASFVPFTDNNILLSTGAVSFDATTFEYWGMLLNGGCLVLCPKETLLDETQLAQTIQQHKVNMMWFTAGWLNQLVDKDPATFAGLQIILAGGDKLSPEHINKLKAAYPELTIVNGYGPTENTTFSLTHTIQEVGDNIPIGKPINNSTVYILGPQHQLMPLGAIGEICVGGDGLALGYLNQPELTAEKFVANPFVPGERMYKTGDLGRWLPDGTIAFMGRRDEQVKVRGYRIELGEIETVLQSHPAVDAAVVVALPNKDGEKEVVAYVVAKETLNATALSTYMGTSLPAYMIPTQFVQLEALPLNANGKVDKKALPDPMDSGLGTGVEYIAPRNTTEERLVAIWQEVLDRETISVKDNFFDLGGHSLKATKLASQVHKELNVKLELKDIFTKPVLEDQAALIDAAAKIAFVSIEPVPQQADYVLSSSQRRMWLLSQIEEANAAYNMPGVYMFDGELNQSAFDKAFTALIERHEILRTIFRQNEAGEVRQVILDTAQTGFAVEHIDLRGEKEPETVLGQLVHIQNTQPFNLSTGPLLRAAVYQVADDKALFAYNMHHIISDGWSKGILVSELLGLYNAFVANQPNPFAPLRIQYKDYAAWQQHQLSGDNLETHKGYWLQHFAGELPVLDLPNDKMRPAVQSFNGAMVGKVINATVSQGIKALAQQQGGTLFMGLLAGVNALFNRYTGQEDIILGTPIAGREHADLHDQIGFYVNTLALRNRFSSMDNFHTLLKGVKEVTMGAYEHQVYPFDELVDNLDLQRDMSRNQLFDVMVILQNNDAPDASGGAAAPQLSGLQVSDYGSGGGHVISKFDMTLAFGEVGDEVHLNIEYNTDIYSAATVTQLANHLEQLLEQAVQNPDTAISLLDYLTAEEKKYLLTGINNTTSAYDKGVTMVDLIEVQVAATPDSPAVFFGEASLTYNELNEAANRVAHWLRQEHAVKADDLIGIQLERTGHMVAVMLGVLKSGGAYVPIDPAYPQERIDYLINDSRCKLLIDENRLQEFIAVAGNYSTINPDKVISPHDLAYIIYTSGSTGQPKGVMIQHGNVTAFLHWCKKEFGNENYSVMFAGTSICFDISIFEIFYTLTTGKPVRLLADALAIPQYLNRHERILLNTVPSVVGTLIREKTDFSNVTILNMAGEAIPEQYAAHFDCNKIPLRNFYGPSEDTTYSTIYHLKNNEPILIGRPIDNSQVYIVSPQGQMCPVGVVGEIWIGGDGVSRGYLHRAELTEEKYIPNPFVPGDRIYKTGDLGRWLWDTNLGLSGRRDTQVKVRGYRIELGEVEIALQSHPAVETAAVVVKTTVDGDREMVAYICAKEPLATETLRTYLGNMLPGYMVPGYFVQLDTMPLTLNGKIDRKKLPAPEGLGMGSGAAYVAPRNETEERLAAIWAEVLGRENISVNDNFFSIGGHSLRATRLVSLIHKEFDVKFGLKDIFIAPILEQQAELIIHTAQTSFAGITPVPLQANYPLSSSQRRLWVLSQFPEGSVAYNMPGSYVFEGDFNQQVLGQSFAALIERHEILRTVFRQDEAGNIAQYILTPEQINFGIDFIDLRQEASLDTVLSGLVQQQSTAPFDLAAGPLIRAAIYQTADAQWVFSYCMHHIISDGGSMSVLIGELLALYNAFNQAQPNPLQPLNIQYKDYAVWQQQQLSGDNLEAHKDYWLSQFEGELPVIDLPSEKMRPAVKTYNGSAIGKAFDPQVYEGLKKMVQEQGGTLFMGLLAGVNLLLNRYTGLEDIILGTPTAGREHADLQNQIGFYINTLVLRNRFSSNDSFRQLLGQVKEQTLGAFQHQVYPFDALVDDLNLQHDTSRGPLFDIMVVMQNNEAPSAAGGAPQMGAVSISAYGGGTTTSKYDITFNFTEEGGTINLALGFNTDVYSQPLAESLVQHLEQLLAQAIQHPDTAIGVLDYLTIEEKQYLLTGINNTTSAYDKNINIVDLIEAQVTTTPDNPAVLVGDNSLTYKELNEAANRVAHWLRQEHNAKADDLIGIQLERTGQMVAVMLGVLKSGAAYVPIDPAYPQERIDYLINDSRCKLLIDSKALEGFMKVADNYPATNPDKVIHPHDLAYIIYTSGSTGQPKGVMIEHGNVTAFMHWSKKEFGSEHYDVMFAGTSICFDISIFEIFYTLTTGKKIRLLPDALAIPQYLGTPERILLNTVPSVVGTLIREKADFSNVTILNMAGEAIPEQYAAHFDCNKIPLRNFYGPSEDTTYSTIYHLKNNEPILIGRPIDNSQIYIVSPQGQMCPVGVVGEIWIGGDGVSRGYLHRPELTAEKYIDNPFVIGDRVYKTGDLGRWLPDTNLALSGRRDTQVKVRGYRIELGEVEIALQTHPSVIIAAVVVKTNAAGERDMVAYLTAKEPLSTETLRAYLGGILPGYMVPGHFVQLDEMPLTLNGKIDRKKLPDPEGLGMASGAEYIAPSNETEERLVAIWQEILGRETVSIKDNFFNIGGHSLRATRLVSQVHKVFDVKLGLKDIFVTPVLEDQAKLIAQTGKTVFTEIEPVPQAESYTLSSAQRRLWVLSQFEESNLAYNMPAIYTFGATIDPEALNKALLALVERHENLRTIFKENGEGEVRQYILPTEKAGVSVQYQDVRNRADAEAIVQRIVQQNHTVPFNLAEGPLVRVNLLQIADEHWVLTLNMHHIISDGWSMEVLINELLALYGAFATGQPNPLPPLRIQYKDYAAWQQQQLQGELLQQHKTYWLNQFAGELPVLDLPSEKMRPAVKTYNGAKLGMHINAATSNRLKELGQQQGATLFMNLLAGVNALLYRYAGQEDIIIGSPIAGREHADLQGQIGFYINTLALRTRFSGNDSYRQLLENVKGITLGAYEHQVYPFDELVDNLELQRDMSRNALFDVMVVLQNNEGPAAPASSGGNTGVSNQVSESKVSKFDITFTFAEAGDEIRTTIEYNTDIFSEAGMMQLAAHLQQLLEQATAHPDTAIGRLDYLTTEEKQHLLTGINNTISAYDKAVTIVDLIEAQAAAMPNNTAVLFGEATWTYKELNEAANRIAHWLRQEHKVTADNLIGIQLERTGQMLAAMLGVLKSGGAYVPIDTAYPQERIDYLINDSRCQLVIDEQALNNFEQTTTKYSTDNPAKVIKPQDLAYIIYTSGSTGQPKGVMIEHGNVTAFMHWCKEEFGNENYNVIFAGTSICFDISIFEIFYTLTTGKAIRLLSDALAIPQYLGNHQRILLNTVPSVIGTLIREKADFSNVVMVNMAGEAIPEQYVAHFDCERVPLRNLYGPSEDTTYSTIYHLKNNAPVLIGRPITNSQVYIVSPQEQLCPVGVTGEIWIGGEGVSRGYLYRPELTTEKYIDNPFKAGDRVYKTGDLGRWLPDGNLALSGRRDTQVKVRGYRIELGEIEAALQAHPTIETAAVVVKATADGEKEMVAYLCGKETLTSDALRNYLGGLLPGYMVPGYFVQLDAMPLTLNGKIDRKKLPDPEGLGMGSGVEYVAPRNETETTLLTIWTEILGRDSISVKDNFFNIGGHSLRATRLMGQIHKAFDVKLGLKDLFATPVLEDQARLIAQSGKTLFAKIEPIPQAESYALSSAQRRLWVLSQFEESNLAYNMPAIYTFGANIDPSILGNAFKALVERHENLRTVFRENEAGEVRQYILSVEASGFGIHYLDLRGEAQAESIVQRIVQENHTVPFNLAEGPLVRVNLLQVADEHWVLTLNMHHIISDGWSMEVLINELMALYGALATNQPNPLEPLRIQYKDYAAWQQQQLQGEALQQHKTYWLNQFAGELPVLDLPGDKLRPAVKTYNGAKLGMYINAATSNRLKELGQQQGATLFMNLLAGVNALLYRYTGQEDIIIGSPIAGREHADLHNQIGFYINTLALRANFSGDDSYTALLNNIKNITLAAYEHQVYPFDELVDNLELQRDMSRNALFDVMVVLQNNEGPTAAPSASTGNTGVNNQVSESKVSKFDITFTFAEAGDEIRTTIEYNTDIYSEATITQLAKHLEQLLEQAVAHPDTAIGSLDYLSDAEKQQVTVAFNDTAVEYPAGKSVVAVFEAQVALTPYKTALVFDNISYTYSQLNELANQFGHYLRNTYNIAADDVIGIQLQRSHWLMVAILGVLKSGAAYLPLDMEAPQDRVDYMLADSNCKLLIDETTLQQLLAVITNSDTQNPTSITNARSLVYIMYTSGSTGNPKGVMIENGGVVRLVKPLSYMPYTGNEVLLSAGSISFDATTFEFWSILLNGGTLVMCPKEVFLDTKLMAELIQQKGVNTMWFTPGWLNQLVDNDIAIFDRLNMIKVGGDRLSPAHIHALKQRYPKLVMVNGYGPTENTAASCCYTIEQVGSTISIGKPIDNSTAWIVDSRMQLVPIGVVGELLVGGAGVARGYLNNPALTAEKFIDNPFKPGDRIYKTGDLVRWMPDGNIEFIGRKDDQLKIGGYRIEPGEIEAALRKHSDIGDAVVLAKANNKGVKELVAYITGKTQFNISDLRAYLGILLPAYMLPSYFVQLDTLPLNKNGKVDKKALPDPTEMGMSTGAEYVAPRNSTEETLVAIWTEILGREGVSVKDNFFNIGGHSLRATRLMGQIHKAFDVKLGLKDLFATPVLEDQALLIAQSSKTSYAEIEPAPQQDSYALSSAQRRMWVLSQFEESNAAYNMPAVYMLPAVDAVALGNAFTALIDRHEVLRTVFREEEDGDVRQYILPTADCGFSVVQHDIRGHEDAAATIDIIMQANLATPFDLSEGPLLRVSLLQVADDQWLLALNMHHIISDGWSMGVLFNELMTLYGAFATGQPNPLQPLRIQYKDYAAWQQQQLQDGAFQQHKDYWLGQFAGELPILDLPSEKLRPAVKTYNGSKLNVHISAATSNRLKELGQLQGATLFMNLLAGVNTLLYRYTGQEDIILGTPMAGREHADLQGQIGFYINTLALRARFNGNDSYRQLLENVKEITLGAYEHQSYPFDELVDKLELQKDMSRSALFDVMVVLQNNENTFADAPAPTGEHTADVTVQEGGSQVSKFDISFTFVEAGDEIRTVIEYNTDIYSTAFMSQMAAHLVQLFDQAVAAPDTAINLLDYLSATEKEQLLTGINNTTSAYDKNVTIVDLIEAQAAATPDNTAVLFGGNLLTYQQLNEVANRIAHYLRKEQAVQADDLIGIQLERSEWMIAVMLGVLKSGAAYVPIDTTYPQERIDYLLKDSRCKLLIDEKALLAFNEVAANYGTDNPAKVIKPQDLAYIIYTSGSTGQPKGVMITHSNVTAFMHWAGKEFGDAAYDVVFAATSVCFDLSIFEIFYTLTTGKKLRVLPNALSIPQYLGTSDRVLLNTVPSVIGTLIKEGAEFNSVTVLNMAGEAIPEQHVAHFDCEKVALRNLYGPSEDTTYSTIYHIKNDAPILIGRPIDNSQVYIVSPQGQLCPIGVTGEIWIGGDGVSRGYLYKPELAAEKFIDNPFKPGDRLYKTGDLGRWLADGNLALSGRSDTQVKVRGYRIELGEVETALQSFPSVEAAAVVVKTNAEGEKDMVAYLAASESLSADILRAYLASMMPGYMIPGYFVQLPEMPLTLNGKIDRKKLPDPEGLGLESGVEFVEPRNETEQLLLDAWKEILRKEKISVKDNFFHIGGHSLKAMKLLGILNKKHGFGFKVQDIYNQPTIEQMATVQKQGSVSGVFALNQENVDIKNNIYFIPPIFGNSILFKPLAETLTGYCNCYGMQYSGLHKGEARYTSIEQAAEELSNEILKRQQDGNFVIFGYSMGASIAFEMAKILEKKFKVVNLILVDRSVETTAGILPGDTTVDADVDWLLNRFPAAGKAHPGGEATLRPFLVHNTRLMKMYKQKGKIKGGIIALEAEDNKEKTNMKKWKSYAKGGLGHIFIKGDHWKAITSVNFPSFHHAIGSIFPKKQ